jgi:hypothetical protein
MKNMLESATATIAGIHFKNDITAITEREENRLIRRSFGSQPDKRPMEGSQITRPTTPYT